MKKKRKRKKSLLVKPGFKSKKEISFEFGKRIKEVREILNDISQDDFGEKFGMAGSYLSTIESGSRTPGIDFIYKLMVAYNINPLYLLKGEPPVFLYEERPGKEPGKGNEENELKFRELMWYLDNSYIVHHAMIEDFLRYYFQYKEIINNELREKGIDPESIKF